MCENCGKILNHSYHAVERYLKTMTLLMFSDISVSPLAENKTHTTHIDFGVGTHQNIELAYSTFAIELQNTKGRI